MIKWFAKKFIIGKVNEALAALKSNESVIAYKLKITQIVNFLNNLLSYLEDYEISDDEADKVIEECKSLF